MKLLYLLFEKTTMGDANVLNNIYSGTPFNNMSIPGLRTGDVFDEDYSNQNPYFARMSSSLTSTVNDDFGVLNPTLFSVFLGLDDFMPFIKSGARSDSLLIQICLRIIIVKCWTTLPLVGQKV